MKKTIIILTSDPFSINYEIIKKSQNLFKKKLHNKYLFIGDQKDIDQNIKKKNKFINFLDIARGVNTKIYLKNCFNLAFDLLKNKKAHGLINLPLNSVFCQVITQDLQNVLQMRLIKKGKKQCFCIIKIFLYVPTQRTLELKMYLKI